MRLSRDEKIYSSRMDWRSSEWAAWKYARKSSRNDLQNNSYLFCTPAYYMSCVLYVLYVIKRGNIVYAKYPFSRLERPSTDVELEESFEPIVIIERESAISGDK